MTLRLCSAQCLEWRAQKLRTRRSDRGTDPTAILGSQPIRLLGDMFLRELSKLSPEFAFLCVSVTLCENALWFTRRHRDTETQRHGEHQEIRPIPIPLSSVSPCLRVRTLYDSNGDTVNTRKPGDYDNEPARRGSWAALRPPG